MPSHPVRPMLSALIPLALGACMNAGPTAAIPPAGSVPLGVDLGASEGRPAHSSATDPIGGGHELRHSAQPADMHMAQDGHLLAQASGIVNSVDAPGRKINISHESIHDLGWPPMTMDFPVAQAVDLGSVKPGNRVNFILEKGSDGVQVIQALNPIGTGGQ